MVSDPSAEVFPQELFDLVIEAAGDDRSTLLNLCLVSRDFLPGAQRRLYQQVGLGGVRLKGGGHNRWHISHTNNDTLFFTTLSHTPHLAHCVREFSYRPDAGHSGANPWGLFHQALHEMVNLKRLQLTLMTCDYTLSRILEGLGQHPFQLEVFSWKDYRWKMSDNEPLAFLSFLLTQPHLQVLDILSESLPLTTLLRSICPNLTTFIGNLTHALKVLRHRAIDNFVWTAGLEVVKFDLSLILEAELSRLRVLVFHDYFPVRLNHMDLASSLQSLEALHISFTPHRVNQAGLTLVKIAEFLSHLPTLRNLRMVAWTGVTPAEWRSMIPAQTFDAAAGGRIAWLFDNNPCLERVYVSEPNRLYTWDCYRRWKRGEVHPTEVGRDELEKIYRNLGFDSSLIDGRVIYGL